MSDIFDQLSAPFEARQDEPVAAAQAAMKPALIKRFYSTVTAEEIDGQWVLQLDGRTVKTPLRQAVAAPHRTAADTLVGEWDGQGEHIDPAAMPLTRLINAAIDGVADRKEDTAGQIAEYLSSDLVCYRASGPDRLVARQAATWDPLIGWLSQHHQIELAITSGVMPISQDGHNAGQLHALLAEVDHFALAALHSLTNLTGSAVLALALRDRHLTPDEAWSAAHLDEDWNEELWGADHEAQARRAKRHAEFKAACILLAID